GRGGGWGLEGQGRGGGRGQEVGVIDPVDTGTLDLGQQCAAWIGGNLRDRVSFRSETEAMHRQRRFALPLVVCFQFLRHGNRPLVFWSLLFPKTRYPLLGITPYPNRGTGPRPALNSRVEPGK